MVANANIAARREVNIDNGDFSTSYFALAFDRRTGRIIDVTGAMRRSREWGAEYQVHPLGLKPGGADRDQASAYGTHEMVGRYAQESRHAEIGSIILSKRKISVVIFTSVLRI